MPSQRAMARTARQGKNLRGRKATDNRSLAREKHGKTHASYVGAGAGAGAGAGGQSTGTAAASWTASYAALHKAFPDAPGSATDGLTIAITDMVTCFVDPDGDITVWDVKGNTYVEELAAARADVERSTHDTVDEIVMVVLTLQELVTGGAAGFGGAADSNGAGGADLPLYDASTDTLVQGKLRAMAATQRDLTVYTYGERYPTADVQDLVLNPGIPVFNARKLQSRHKSVTRKMRGTDKRVQHVLRAIPEFPAFITNLVATVEEGDMHTIGVFCAGGRHRSVGTGEILRAVYDNVVVKHLTMYV